ncbi:MAG: tRNA (adenosine(37)-N6)-threonylcarbamoyltransferase complex transferase subunit TsaD [Flavobacteriales bacterium]|nr:tRNA (adenosine(37)-N6)-threonylcarbamoyltransferase complex transferase subunit TsaD [Flavobacteriales bacterium]
MPSGPSITLLGIESSCDETAAAVMVDGVVRSNRIAGQEVHRAWGGVVPELASRAHQEHIVPVVDDALRQAGVRKEQLDAIAFTQGPGLVGALLVGTCFARSMAQALGKPLIAVDHLKAHVLAHFIQDIVPRAVPAFPFINLTVSGGHTQLILVRGALRMEIIGTTLDDAAGEAFDKGAKVLGLPYPGGPEVDRVATGGDPERFVLPVPAVQGLDMSFSGIKTAFAHIVRKGVAAEADFVAREQAHLCASLQQHIVDVLLRKVQKAGRAHGIPRIGISGGVSANNALRTQAAALAQREGWELFVPPLAYCTDNAAMIAMAGHFMHLAGQHAPLDTMPVARW